jgi:glycerate-2-kinase
MMTNHYMELVRNQELALAAAVKLQEIGLRNVVLASVGTDGTDGPTGKSIAVLLSCYCLTKI